MPNNEYTAKLNNLTILKPEYLGNGLFCESRKEASVSTFSIEKDEKEFNPFNQFLHIILIF